MVMMHVWFIGIARKSMARPLFLLFWGFSVEWEFQGLILWHLWIGRAQHPGPAPSFQVGVEVFNVGGG